MTIKDSDGRWWCELCHDWHPAGACPKGQARLTPEHRIPWHDKAAVRAMIDAPVPPPVLRQKNSAERKAEPIYSGALMYFPDALAAVARLSLKANNKHNPGEPMHWAREKSNDQMDCATRHSITPNNVDHETGEIELVQAAWRILAELQLTEEKRLVAQGIIPYSGVTK